jgi:hypothetical protein
MEYQNENFNGEYDFRSRFHKGWYMQANLHEYSELIYCQKGSGYVTVNGNAIFLKENEMVWIPPNYIHQYDFDSAELICAVFSNDFIPLFFKKLKNRYYCPSAINIGELSYILKKTSEHAKRGLVRNMRILKLNCRDRLRTVELRKSQTN